MHNECFERPTDYVKTIEKIVARKINENYLEHVIKHLDLGYSTTQYSREQLERWRTLGFSQHQNAFKS